ncbi:MAG: IS630 family transposase [Candidatus Sulfotelmatobacter sp.]
MRGRKPRPLSVAAGDLQILRAVARARRLPWFEVQHARIVLAVAAGEPIGGIADRLECDPATVWRVCRRYEQGGLKALLLDEPRIGRPHEISPLQRAQIIELACLEPIAEGLHITHWTSKDLVSQAIADGIVPDISDRTVRRILAEVDLQPHRTRYWKTSRLDEQFKQRAEQVLWCYENAARLARQGIWVVAVDEKPNHQVLERSPIRRAIPGSIEQQEFEYTRHGTVNLLFFLIVHSGRMEVAAEDSKDAEHYIREMKAFRRRHSHLKRVFLVQDGDPSHTAGDTATYWSGCGGWWRPRFTPVHSSWLNQAESLIEAFSYYYLKRGSWRSRAEFIEHVRISGPEYNQRYAHPFNWLWSPAMMRKWFAEHTPQLSCTTYGQPH